MASKSAAGRDRLRHYLDAIDRWKQVITGFDARIARLLADLERDLASLVTIPGIGRLRAEIIVAETGVPVLV